MWVRPVDVRAFAFDLVVGRLAGWLAGWLAGVGGTSRLVPQNIGNKVRATEYKQ